MSAVAEPVKGSTKVCNNSVCGVEAENESRPVDEAPQPASAESSPPASQPSYTSDPAPDKALAQTTQTQGAPVTPRLFAPREGSEAVCRPEDSDLQMTPDTRTPEGVSIASAQYASGDPELQSTAVQSVRDTPTLAMSFDPAHAENELFIVAQTVSDNDPDMVSAGQGALAHLVSHNEAARERIQTLVAELKELPGDFEQRTAATLQDVLRQSAPDSAPGEPGSGLEFSQGGAVDPGPVEIVEINAVGEMPPGLSLGSQGPVVLSTSSASLVDVASADDPVGPVDPVRSINFTDPEGRPFEIRFSISADPSPSLSRSDRPSRSLTTPVVEVALVPAILDYLQEVRSAAPGTSISPPPQAGDLVRFFRALQINSFQRGALAVQILRVYPSIEEKGAALPPSVLRMEYLRQPSSRSRLDGARVATSEGRTTASASVAAEGMSAKSPDHLGRGRRTTARRPNLRGVRVASREPLDASPVFVPPPPEQSGGFPRKVAASDGRVASRSSGRDGRRVVSKHRGLRSDSQGTGSNRGDSEGEQEQRQPYPFDNPPLNS